MLGKINKKRSLFMRRDRLMELIFYICLIIIPFIQFIIMYVCVNFRSILFAFQSYDGIASKFIFESQAFYNNFIGMMTKMFATNSMATLWQNSIIYYLIGLLFQLPLSIFIAFFVYKKLPFAGYFRIVLYLPCIVASMATVLGFKYFAEFGFVKLFPGNPIFDNKFGGVISNPNTTFAALTFYAIWSSLGGNLVLMTGVMSRTSMELLEASHMDGVNLVQEFCHIIWPVIYPIVIINIYTGIVSVFTGGPPLFAFFSSGADPQSQTFGYYFFTLVVGNTAQDSNYPMAATGGLIFTMIAAPIVFFLKYILEKYDPNEERVVKIKKARA